MTIKQQINHGIIQKVCHLHYGIFHSIHLCHILSIVDMVASAYRAISKEIANRIFSHI